MTTCKWWDCHKSPFIFIFAESRFQDKYTWTTHPRLKAARVSTQREFAPSLQTSGPPDSRRLGRSEIIALGKRVLQALGGKRRHTGRASSHMLLHGPSTTANEPSAAENAMKTGRQWWWASPVLALCHRDPCQGNSNSNSTEKHRSLKYLL